MKKLWFLLAALLIFLPVGLWWFSADQVIMRRTKHLMEVLSISEGSAGPMRQAKVFSMNAMLAPVVELVSPDISDANGTFDKQELESAFSWICQNAKSSTMRVTDFRSVTVNGDKAEVLALIEGYLELPYSRPADGSFEVTIHWVKGDDGWRFTKIIWKTI